MIGGPGTGCPAGLETDCGRARASEKTIRGWIADAATADDRPPIFKVAAAPQAPVMAERGELLRWLLRRVRRYPVTEA